VVAARAGNEGRLFGSITANDIADAASRQFGVTVDRKAIHVGEPIRTVGEHAVPFDLGHGVTGSLTISVSAK
jgi:large subunit ribosomal protein L9